MSDLPRYPKGHRRPGIHGMKALYCSCGKMYQFDQNRQTFRDRTSGWHCPEAERLLAKASR